MNFFEVLLAVVFIFVITCGSYATTIHVPTDQPTVQEGIDTAVEGDTVLVHPGTYSETLSFNGKSIVVGSLFVTTADTIYINNTILDKVQNGPVVTFSNYEDNNAILRGFTVSNSTALYIGNMIACLQSSPSLLDLKIKGCVYDPMVAGGGIWCMNNSSPFITNVEIFENEASQGGGIYCYANSSPTIINSTIKDNYALFGGALYCNNYSSPSLTNVILTGNEAENMGGGIETYNNSNPILTNVTITDNIATYGGGIYSGNSTTLILNNVTIANNQSTMDGGGLRLYSMCHTTLVNTILWNNSPNEVYLFDEYFNTTLVVSYTDISGGEDGIVTNIGFTGTIEWLEGNIDSEPLFTDEAGGDYSLLAGSPCIDTGDPVYNTPPGGGCRIDIGAFEFWKGFNCIKYNIPLPLK